ncbi:hypothetical protein DTO164E3_5019 [Paecilomyces variotii]|nr:hypothetical protein DTO164E3_5019 [Paecilomyces variotii]KAJ9410451.1 hypothetical protein DTO045G8_1914 [Paecilomyces variotii]
MPSSSSPSPSPLSEKTHLPTSPRRLLIPSKRTLLPIPLLSSGSSSSSCNPSAYPAEIQIRKPAFSSAVPSSEAANADTSTGTTSRDESKVGDMPEPIVIEFDSSRAPQPFLDPMALEKVRAMVRMREEERKRSLGTEAEEDEETRRRREREAEYGGMAVRGRSRAVAGRRGGRR